MILELSRSAEKVLCEQADICIIGGGTAGLYLAQRLRRGGKSVTLLESGNRALRRPGELDMACRHRRMTYRGAEHGRAFGLGGTSALWGGQMIPLTASDFRQRPAASSVGWPLGREALAPWFATVAQDLGLSHDPDEETNAPTMSRFRALSTLGGPDLQLRLSQWIPFKRRNFAQLFASTVRDDEGLRVWTDATVTHLERSTTNPGRIGLVRARDVGGRELSIAAQEVVICAGALESTRLVLELDRAMGGQLRRDGSPIGENFCDHLSVSCGRFVLIDRPGYNHATAPVFQGQVMRTPRLEVSGATQERLAIASAFAHFTFRTDGRTGFDWVRDLLRRRQGLQPSSGLSAELAGRAIRDVTALAWWRTVHRRMWLPTEAEPLLQVDIEQAPVASNRLLLDDTLDTFGRRRLVIDWGTTEGDLRTLQSAARLVESAWNASPARRLAALQLTDPQTWQSGENLYDVFHPTGSLRMGARRSGAVTDPHLQIWGIENCHVSSTAVFPTAGSANPGFTHLALTARLADRLKDRGRA